MSRLKLVMGVTIAAAVVAGAIIVGRMDRGRSDLSLAAGALTHDFGEVDVSRGAQELAHTFALENRGTETLIVEDIIPTCGCLGARVNGAAYMHGEPINPWAGRSVELELVMNVSTPGDHMEGATVRLSNGDHRRYAVRARGRADERFEVFLHSVMRTELGWEARLRVYRTGAVDDATTAMVPIFTSDSSMQAAFEGWKVIEAMDASISRPSRMVGAATLTFTNENESAADVRIALGELAAKEVRVPLQ